MADFFGSNFVVFVSTVRLFQPLAIRNLGMASKGGEALGISLGVSLSPTFKGGAGASLAANVAPGGKLKPQDGADDSVIVDERGIVSVAPSPLVSLARAC